MALFLAVKVTMMMNGLSDVLSSADTSAEMFLGIQKKVSPS